MDHPEPRPIWYDHVPPGFWRRSANRRAFMEWLERKLDVRKPEDWYELTSATIRRFGGRGLLQQCFVSFRQACMTAAEGRRYRRLSDEQPMEDSR